MSMTETETRSVVVEREVPHPPEKIWRALTQPRLIEEWLMKTDFRPLVSHQFSFRADWGAVDCEVLAIEPLRKLSYTWNAKRAGESGGGLKSIVTWTLTPTEAGTLLRMEQSGFRREQAQYFGGAKQGWPQLFANLERVLSRVE